jgi:hypothetical protein
MSFSINPCWYRIQNYKEAQERYESITPIKFKLASNQDHYGADCRPLGRRNAPWMRIEKGGVDGGGFFDFVLYQTVMVRYYEDGRIVVAPNGISKHHHSISSGKFLDATLPSFYDCWVEGGYLVVRGNKKKPRREDYVVVEKEVDGNEYRSVDWAAYHDAMRSQQTLGIVPCDGVGNLELDIESRGFKNAAQAHYLTLNRSVTKLHREKVEPIIEQAYALAAIIDGADVNSLSWDEAVDLAAERAERRADDYTPDEILRWMKSHFCHGEWGEWGLTTREYRRTFRLPTRKEFNKKFYPSLYWTVEMCRDVEKDPSPFNVVPYPTDRYLKSSPKWYGLNAKDPRHKTYPVIL